MLKIIKTVRTTSFYVLCATVFVIALLFLNLQKSHAQKAFGGPINLIFYICNQGQKITLGPPTGGDYIYGPASRSYLNGRPSRMGQYLLGMSAGWLPCTYQCGPYTCVNGGGFLILYHGSSM
jgi:hypothetical protein